MKADMIWLFKRRFHWSTEVTGTLYVKSEPKVVQARYVTNEKIKFLLEIPGKDGEE